MGLRKDAGYAVFSDPGSDVPILELATVQCCHCGGHFPAPRFGNSAEDRASRLGMDGKHPRGWCHRCNGYICGAGCLECVPVELYIENIEKGRPDNFIPINVSFAGIGGEKAGDIWTPGK